MKNSIFAVSILDQTVAQGRLQLKPIGLAGVVTLQGTAEAPSYLQVSSGIVHDVLIINIIDWNRVMSRCSLATSNFGFFLLPIY